MRGFLVLAWLLVVVTLAVAQPVPKLTESRKKAVIELFQLCYKGKAFTAEKKDGKSTLRLHPKVMAKVMTDNRAKLDSEVIDGLLAVWRQADTGNRVIVVWMLKAIAEEKKDERTRGLAAFLSGMGEANAQYYRAAVQDFTRAAEHFAKAKDAAWEAAALNNAAYQLQQQGDPGRALKLFRRALAIDEKLYPATKYPRGHDTLVNALNNVGYALVPLEEHAEALKYFRRALDMLLKLYPPKDHPDGTLEVAMAYNNIAAACKSLGQRKQALGAARLSLAMSEKLLPAKKFPNGHPRVITATGNLSQILVSTGEKEEARKYAKASLAMARKYYSEEDYPRGHPALVHSHLQLAYALMLGNNYTEALASLKTAREMAEKLYPEKQYPGGHPLIAGIMSDESLTYYMQGKVDEALKRGLQSARMQRGLLLDRLLTGSEAQNLNTIQDFQRLRHLVLSLSCETKTAPDKIYATLWPVRAAVTRVQEQRQLSVLAATASTKVKTLFDRLVQQRNQRSRLLLSPLPRDVKSRDALLEKLDKEIVGLEEDLLAQLPAFKQSRTLARSTPANLQKVLPSGAAFVDVLRYAHAKPKVNPGGQGKEQTTPRYVAFVVTRGAINRVELGEAKPIEEALTLWRRGIKENSDSTTKYGTTLRKLVWDNLAKSLKGITTVYIAPDDALTRLPWSALPGDKANRILLEQYTFATVPHGVHLLDRLTAKDGKKQDKPILLAVGGVKYDDKPASPSSTLLAKLDRAAIAADEKKTLKWDYLKGTETEVARLKGMAKNLTLKTLTGADAATARILSELAKANVAHLATHGFFADAQFRSALHLDESLFKSISFIGGGTAQRIGAGARSPLILSGLVLAGANRKETPDRGIVSADDIARLDLRKLDLAVLSACETGLGEVGGGEGVFGLQRAFHMAGTKNVIASLWKVNDEATAALMVLFYRYLLEEKKTPLEALRLAQLALYHNPGQVKKWAEGGRGINLKTIYTGTGKAPPEVKPTSKMHPRLWAAFTLSGLGR